MSDSFVERRAHARFPRSFEFQGSVEEGAVARMVASDLSLGGLYCTSTVDFPEMTRLAVRLALAEAGSGDGGQTLEVEAVVVRRTKLGSTSGAPRYELALLFTRMSGTQRQHIARFLAQT